MDHRKEGGGMSMKTLPLVATSAFFLLSLTAADGGCGASGTGAPSGGQQLPPGRVFACDTQPEAPETTMLGRTVAVMGATISTCDVAPQEHHVTVWLDYRINGIWTTQHGAGGQPAANCYDVPGHNNKSKTCKWIITPCRDGAWRTRVAVYGYGPDGKPFNFNAPETPSSFIKCR